MAMSNDQEKVMQYFRKNKNVEITADQLISNLNISNQGVLFPLVRGGYLNVDNTYQNILGWSKISIGINANAYFEKIEENERINSESRNRQDRADEKQKLDLILAKRQVKSFYPLLIFSIATGLCGVFSLLSNVGLINIAPVNKKSNSIQVQTLDTIPNKPK